MRWKEGACDVFAHAGYEWVFEPRKHKTMTLIAIRGIDKPDSDPDGVTLDDFPPAVRKWVVTHDRDFYPQTSSIGAAMGVVTGP